MAREELDVVVLGGGPGGYPCAIRAAQLGLRVALVEEEEVGGVCLNWGCIPSKALISNAHLWHQAQAGAEVGIHATSLSLDVPRMQEWKDGIVKKLTGGVKRLLAGNGARLVEGRGRLREPRLVEVTRPDGTTLELAAARGVVVATGSATIELGAFPFDGRRIVGAREAVSLREVPRRLLVIGGGVIGCELGMVYQAFGSELTVVELTAGLLPGVDEEAARLVQKSITRRGGQVLTGARAEGFREAGGALEVRIAGPGGDSTVIADLVLVAVGMRPRSRGIGLEELGVHLDGRGFVTTDDQCRTNLPGVYAVGDVSGPPMLAHKATKEGEVCAEVLAGQSAGKDWVTIPNIVFTDPEVASVGLTEAAAREAGHTLRIGRFPFAALGRALSIRQTEGFVKVVADAASGRLLGVHLVGPAASDLVSEAALALEMGATLEDLALTVHPHPTLGEALMEAAQHALGHAIHVVNR